MNDGMKPAGVKGAIRVYKTLYDVDRLSILPCFPVAAINAAKPYFAMFATAYVIDGFLSGQEYSRLLAVALFAAVLTFLANVLQNWLKNIQNTHNDVTVRKVYAIKAEKYITVDFPLLESPKINEINARIHRDNNWGGGFFNCSYYLNNFLQKLFGFIAGLGVLVNLLMRYRVSGAVIFVAGIMLFGALMAYLVSSVFGARITKFLKTNLWGNDETIKKASVLSQYMMHSSETGGLLKTARLYNINPMLMPYFDKNSAAVDGWAAKFTKLNAGQGLVSGFSHGVIAVAAYLFIVGRAVAGAISVGNVILFVGAFHNMASGFLSLAFDMRLILDQTTRIQSTLDFMEMPRVMEKGTLPVEKRLDNEYEIEFRNVSFKYPGSEKYALKNFDMKLSIGQKLAIVGLNGSGKTTMIKLLCRLYDPTEGEITLNGIDVRKYDYREYQNIFSVVFQDFKLLSLTIAQNLACGGEEDKSLALEVLSLVGMGERVKNMPLGVDTYIYNDFENGVEISGGEAQKIALARAVYKNAPFILLDEPTSALDPIAEYEIYKDFSEITTDRTAIYISHRLASCRFCHDIAVFHEGRLVQRGSHEELLSDVGGKYHELWNAQAQYYTEGQ